MSADKEILKEMWRIEQEIKGLERIKNNKGKPEAFKRDIQDQINEKKKTMDRLKEEL